MRLLTTTLALALLSGCGGSTYAEFEMDPSTGATRGKIVDGKDREGAELELVMPDGSRLYFSSVNSDGSTSQGRVLDTIDRAIEKIP